MAHLLNIAVFLAVVCFCASVNAGAPITFKNPLGPRELGLGNYDGQTPSVYQHTDGFYYYTVTSPSLDSIQVMRSRRLTQWDAAAKSKKVVFNATAPYTHIFEAELQHFDGNWYVYFSMEIQRDMNSSRTFVIASNGGANPIEAEFGSPIQLKAVGEAETTTSFHGTILEYSKNELYYVWASDTKRGSPKKTEKTDTISLFIAPMSSPVQISGPAVRLRDPTQEWEKSILEAPSVLLSPTSNAVFITYFAGDFNSADSCMGMIALRHGFSPLVEENWSEGECVFKGNPKQKVFGVGKTGFTKSSDGTESWMLYTAFDTVEASAQKTLSVRAEKFAWDRNGNPVFPRPAGLDISLKIPSEVQVPLLAPGVRGRVSPSATAGGLGNSKPADDRIREIVGKLTTEIHAEACKKLGTSANDASCTTEGAGQLTVIEYKTQTVAGTNYFVKVRGHGGKIWHARIFEQSWSQTLKLSAIEGPKQEKDTIEYFDASESKSESEAVPAAGGLGDSQPADAHIREVVGKLTSEIHAEACKKLGTAANDASCSKEGAGEITVLNYKSQTVAGTNYFVKVRGHGGKIWHARIFEQSWTDTLQLSGIEGPKQEKDDIEYFDASESESESDSADVPVTGGLGDEQPADAHIREIVGKLTSEIHAEACKKLGTAANDASCSKAGAGELTVLNYKTQTVAGTNYFVKLRGHGGKIWHARIFEQTWTQTLQLSALNGPKQEKDQIAYFE